MRRERVGRFVRSTAVALALVLAALGAPAKNKPAPSDQDLRELRDKIERLQKGLAAKEESRGEATEQLRASSLAVSEARRALFELSQRRREIEGELEGIAAQEQEARAGIARQEDLAGKLLRLQYQQGSPDRLRLLLEGRDAATVARQLDYYGYIQRARGELIEELRRKSGKLAALGEEARQRREELAANEAQQADETRRLEKERATRAALVGKLAGEIAKSRREIGRLKRDETRLARLVQEIARAIAKPPRRNTAPAQRVENVADASSSSRPFESLKGQLRLPVRGELAGRFGQPREEAGTTWKGLFIRSVTGEMVHAVADGRVVYADWLRGFGNLLILDHGAGFMSLYAYNEGLLRKVGEMVRGGDPVAEVGASGQSAESGLYFELRRDGKPFDPMRWVAQ
ncbi:MAG TPA: peptidoglycan DD-metalloendopeptidase family protein [Usitatibacter sp.]|nr:peptidoglycan DD-metalloendopeptidase family protein [Usitatibacter sp.]